MGFSSGITRTGVDPARTSALGRPLATRPHVDPAPVGTSPATTTATATTTAQLLDAFASAFGRGDAGGVADCFTVPAIVVSDDRSVVFGSRAEVIDGFSAVLTRYWTSGVVPAGYVVRSEAALTAHLLEVSVIWCHRDTADTVRFHDQYRYVLRRDDDLGLRIHVAVVVDGDVDVPVRSA